MDLFAYGSLMVPEVMELVAGGRFTAEPARLADHRRLLLRDAVYPALVPEPGETVAGVLWRGLDARALARLDRFEGSLYERVELSVALASGARRAAFVYRLRPEHRTLARDGAWDEAAFRARHLAAFLAECRAFVRELEAGA